MKSNSICETEAWVLHRGPEAGGSGKLSFESFTFPAIADDEVLTEPLYGCWEGNMSHAIERKPVDIARQRGEEMVVIGNAGVVRIIEKGSAVTTCEVGDVCIVFCIGEVDKKGYPEKILGYDAPGTMGVLAKRSKMRGHSVIPIPKNSKFSLPQWAAFSLRYVTAWSNWKIALNCWKSQNGEFNPSEEYVLAWGGGVSYAQAILALREGFNVAMITSNDARKAAIEADGMTAIDRREFPKLNFDPTAYRKDPEFKADYLESEKIFSKAVDEFTGGNDVSILIDYLGLPVYRASLKVLARQGVITTAGWKDGMVLTNYRAIECIKRHIHVHTHYANYAEGLEAVAYAEEKGWMPEVSDAEVYSFEKVPQLKLDYDKGAINSYFPVFKVNNE